MLLGSLLRGKMGFLGIESNMKVDVVDINSLPGSVLSGPELLQLSMEED